MVTHCVTFTCLWTLEWPGSPRKASEQAGPALPRGSISVSSLALAWHHPLQGAVASPLAGPHGEPHPSLVPTVTSPLAGPRRWPHPSLVPAGGPGAVDWECRPHAGQQRPHVHAAADPRRPDPHLLHIADLSLHVGEQAHGGHRQGMPAPAPARVGSAHCRATKAPHRALCLSQNSDWWLMP